MLAIPSVKVILLIFAFNILIGIVSQSMGVATFTAPELPEAPSEGGESLLATLTLWVSFFFSFALFMFSFIYPSVTGLPTVVWLILILPLYIATSYILASIILWAAQTIGQIIPFT